MPLQHRALGNWMLGHTPAHAVSIVAFTIIRMLSGLNENIAFSQRAVHVESAFIHYLLKFFVVHLCTILKYISGLDLAVSIRISEELRGMALMGTFSPHESAEWNYNHGYAHGVCATHSKIAVMP